MNVEREIAIFTEGVEPSSGRSFAAAADVLGFVAGRQASGVRCALVVVTAVEGGGVRAPGALLAVDGHGGSVGYVSNGCIDADVIAQARVALEDGRPRRLRYGEGSPFIDLRLPCGGAIDLLIVPDPDAGMIADAAERLQAREWIDLVAGEEDAIFLGASASSRVAGEERFRARLDPAIRLRIAGIGAEPIALARLALAAEMAVALQSPDRATLDRAAAIGIAGQRLLDPASPPPASDDGRTAVVLMFHDRDWEPAMLIQALAGPAFYIGAQGSVRTHAARLEGLREHGLAADQLARIAGPIGLVPALREAPLLAASALAEIVAAARG